MKFLKEVLLIKFRILEGEYPILLRSYIEHKRGKIKFVFVVFTNDEWTEI